MKQPPESIPPLDTAKVQSLVGKVCAVPTLTGGGRWWKRILEVKCWNSKDAMLRLDGGRASGRSRWIALSEVEWK